MVEKIDLIDRKILSELDKDARQTLNQIAKKVGKSKQLINYRIKNLEQRGVIKGYNAIIDYSKLGFLSFRVYIKLKGIAPKKQEEFVDFLKKQKEVWWLMSVENICDIAYATFVEDVYEFYGYLEKLSKYNKYIQSKEVVIYSHIRQFSKSYILDKISSREEYLVGASKKDKFDKVDLKLLELISENARISLIDLASKLKMAPQSVTYRLKNLEKKEIVKGYRVNLDLDKLGFKDYKIYLRLINNSRMKDLEDFCKSNKSIVTTNKTIGGADFEIELQLNDLEEFHKILDKLREKFSDIIDSYKYGVARKEIKMVYFPS
ncbi:MAG: winged helix-turn-helix transcriptional regulator [Nanoarchaeota archaeon]